MHIIFLFLTLILLGFVIIPVSAQKCNLPPIPEPGEVISGFKTIAIDDIPENNAKAVHFEHEKSGAQIIFIQSPDTNRTFTVSFKTPPTSSQGIQHILEHTLLASSKNYPGKDVFFDLVYNGYMSYMNAMTSPNYTQFIVSSTSEKQLNAAADFMLDLLFQPSFLEEPRYFYREAFRYDMSDPAAPLNPVGVVYNEMRAYDTNIMTKANNQTMQHLFPDTPDQYISGGDPDEILTLTYEEARDYYQAYYAPSKAKMFIYGDVDYQAFLARINETVFANAEKSCANPEPVYQQPFSAMKEITVDIPVDEGSAVENQSFLQLAYGLPKNLDRDDRTALQLLMDDVFNHESFPLKNALRAQTIGSDYAMAFNDQSLQPSLIFQAQFADPAKTAALYATVLSTLRETVAKGLDSDLIQSVVRQNLLAARFKTESPMKGLELIMAMTSSWNMLDDPFYGAHDAAQYAAIATKSPDYFIGLIQKYILDNPHALLLTIQPKPGLMEEKRAALELMLEERKAAMDEDEITRIVEESAAFAIWDAVPTPPETIDKLAVLTVDELPEEIRTAAVTDERVAGARLISTVAELPDVAALSLINNLETVSPELLQYFNFYTLLLGRLDTEKYSADEVAKLRSSYLFQPTFQLTALEKKYRSNDYQPSFMSVLMYDPADSAEVFDLVYDELFTTRLTEESLPKIRTIMMEQNALLEYQKQNGLAYAIPEAIGIYDVKSRFKGFFSGHNFGDFMKRITAEITEDPLQFLSKLDEARKAVLNQHHLSVEFAGSDGSKEKMLPGLGKLIGAMSAPAVGAETYTLDEYPYPKKNNGILANANVQTILLSASLSGIMPFSTGNSVIANIVTDELLTPEIRLAGGAYGAQMLFLPTSVVLFSYSDPNLTSTLEVFGAVPELLKTLPYTQKELDQHIVTSYSNYTTPKGALTTALEVAFNHLIGKTPEDQINEYRELKAVTLSDLPKIGEALEKALTEDSQITVYGASKVIQENASLFDQITDIR